MKLSDLWVTYLAADKYLVEELRGELILGSMNRLNKFNVCLLYDQFLRIPFDDTGSLICREATLNSLKKFIQAYSRDAFESESFTEIEEDTLVNLLGFEFLNMPESDVLNACLKWVNAQVERQGLVATAENKQKVFAPIKHFIRFTDLEDEQLGKMNELKEALSLDEFASLFLKLTKEWDQFSIEYKTERKKGKKIYSVSDSSSSYFSPKKRFSELKVKLKSNQKVCITSIQLLSNIPDNLKLKVFKYEPNEKEFVQLAFLEFTLYRVYGKQYLEPGRPLEIDLNVDYKFVFNFAEHEFCRLQTGTSFGTDVGQDRFSLMLSEFDVGHLIREFEFCQISNYETAKST